MLELKQVSIQYGGNKPAVENFSLKVNPCEIIAIVGESGSGKTSVIRGILGLLPGDGKIVSGDILWNESSLCSLSEKQWSALRGFEIAMIFQDSGSVINPIRKIGKQFVDYILRHKKVSKNEAYNMAVEMLERTNLTDPQSIMKSYPFQLSGGMRQRVGIAMAMTFSPKLLLADEPTSALDVTTQAQIVEELAQLRQNFGTSILLVTHNLGVAAYLADRIVVMKDGAIVEDGDRRSIMENPQHPYTKQLIGAVPTFSEVENG